jgi:hypothetical protein
VPITHAKTISHPDGSDASLLQPTDWNDDHVNQDTGQFTVGWDGGGSAVAAGTYQDVVVPHACTITGWTLTADVSGSAVVDIWKDTYANYPPAVADTITASAKRWPQATSSASTLTPHPLSRSCCLSWPTPARHKGERDGLGLL